MRKIISVLSIASFFALAVVSVADAAVLVVHNDNPAIGNEIRFSGTCETTAGQLVEIAIVQGSTVTVIGRIITSTNGVYSATLTIPDTVARVNGFLRATCPDGIVASAAITLTPDNDGGLVVTPTAPAAEGTTPAGGVAAGTGSSGSMLGWMLLTVALTLGGYAAYRVHEEQSLV